MHASEAAIAHDDDVIAGLRGALNGVDQGFDLMVRLHARTE